jgi:hypothetical protein
MPTRFPQDVSGGSLKDLRLPPRAQAALIRAGITRIDQLAVLTRRELAAVDGLGPGMIAAIRRVVPEPGGSLFDQPEEDSPDAPAIPSFNSLRAPRRATPADVLTAGRTAPAPSAAAPRPPDYGDLLRLGVHVARAVVSLPGRVLRWSVGERGRCLRGVLGGTTPRT